jgi:nitroreductase
MEEIIKVIRDRRSVRSFAPQQIQDEELKAVVEAGILAPSAQNRQDWFFTILQNPRMIQKVTDWIIEEARYVQDEKAQEIAATPNVAIFRHAPTVIIVSGEASSEHSRDNCSCAAQNMMLACEALGLGSCWISYVGFLANREVLPKYLAELGIPVGYRPFLGLTVGYKAGPEPQFHPRKSGVVKIFR